MINRIIEKYREKYAIVEEDFADLGETNRLHAIFVSPFFFYFWNNQFILFSGSAS